MRQEFADAQTRRNESIKASGFASSIICPCQKIKGPLNNRQLVFVSLEVEQLPGLTLSPGQKAVHFPLEFLRTRLEVLHSVSARPTSAELAK